jgi:hypothetical protein
VPTAGHDKAQRPRASRDSRERPATPKNQMNKRGDTMQTEIETNETDAERQIQLELNGQED